MRKESFVFICVSLVLGFIIFFYIRDDFGIVAVEDYAPAEGVKQMIINLEKGQSIQTVQKVCSERSAQMPAQKRYAYNHQGNLGDQYFKGTNFDQYQIYFIDEDPDTLIGVFFQRGRLINWMIFPARGHSIQRGQGKEFIQLYRKNKKFAF